MAVGLELEDFIRSTFRSVWTIELLCLLQRHRDRGLSHAEMIADLRGSDLVVTRSIEALTAAGLVLIERNGNTRYRPASKDLDGLAERAAALYAKSPDAVRRMIVAASNPGIAAFADAFRLRKD